MRRRFLDFAIADPKMVSEAILWQNSKQRVEYIIYTQTIKND